MNDITLKCENCKYFRHRVIKFSDGEKVYEEAAPWCLKLWKRTEPDWFCYRFVEKEKKDEVSDK